jgi:hypothetical protein
MNGTAVERGCGQRDRIGSRQNGQEGFLTRMSEAPYAPSYFSIVAMPGGATGEFLHGTRCRGKVPRAALRG